MIFIFNIVYLIVLALLPSERNVKVLLEDLSDNMFLFQIGVDFKQYLRADFSRLYSWIFMDPSVWFSDVFICLTTC